jgi:hypothetical protein
LGWKKSIGKIASLAAITILGRIFLYWIPGVAPVIPIALYTGAMYGLDAAILVAVPSIVISYFLIQQQFSTDPFSGFTPVFVFVAIGFIVASIILSVKILKIGKHGEMSPEILIYRTFIATLFIEVGISLMQGQIIRSPQSYYHIIANIIIAGVVGIIGQKKKE